MDCITTKEAAEKWSLSGRRIFQYCTAQRMKGAVQMGKHLADSKKRKKPADGRFRNRKSKETA